MDRLEAMTILPTAYRRILELRDQGVNQRAMADDLDVDPKSIPNLLKLAEAKLHALTDDRAKRGR